MPRPTPSLAVALLNGAIGAAAMLALALANAGTTSGGRDLVLAAAHVLFVWIVASGVIAAVASTTGVAAAIGLSLALDLAVVSDAVTYRILGLHLYTAASTQNTGLLAMWNETRISLSTTASVLGLLVVVGLAHLVIARWSRGGALRPTRRQKLAGAGALVALLAGLHGLASPAESTPETLRDALPLYRALHYYRTVQEPFRVLPPALPALEKPPGKVHVLFVLVESLRADMLTVETMPFLSEMRATSRCIASRKHYANGHATQFGVFAALYGLYPHLLDGMQADGVAPAPIAALKRAGFRVAGASASELERFANAGFMFQGFDSYEQFVATRDWKDDEKLVDWLGREHESSAATSSFHFAFFNAPHHDYHYPPEAEIFKPAAGLDFNYLLEKYGNARMREGIFNRYRNAVHYVDGALRRVVERWRSEWEAGELIVVVTGDHGEEFFDLGGYGHAATRFIDPRIRVPLIFCSKAHVPETGPEPALSSHVDLMPTLFALLGANSAWDGIGNGRNLLAPAPSEAFTFVTGSGYPYRNPQIALVTPDRKLWLRKLGKKLASFEAVSLVDGDDAPAPEAAADFLARWQARIASELGRFTSRSEEILK